jgi:hypothetical protein
MSASWGLVPVPDRVAYRAATRYQLDEATGCWISDYSTASHGCAQIGWQDDEKVMRGTTAHRAAWVHHNGQQVPDGQTIDHTCKNRRCVRRDHLRVLVNLENARRTNGRDWPLGTCLHGHGPEHWKPKNAQRKKGYCAECRRLMRLRNVAIAA